LDFLGTAGNSYGYTTATDGTPCEASNFKGFKRPSATGWENNECWYRSITVVPSGKKVRTRQVFVIPTNGGRACPALQETAYGGTPCPIDCVMSQWTSWSDCTKACAGGIQLHSHQHPLHPSVEHVTQRTWTALKEFFAEGAAGLNRLQVGIRYEVQLIQTRIRRSGAGQLLCQILMRMSKGHVHWRQTK